MRVLGIIPARGGSKGIPQKNIVFLGGQPLLHYTARSAQESKRLSRTVLSSDDPQIIQVGRSLGLEVPFVRPAELASDIASSLSVVQHALHAIEEAEGQRYDAVCLLQPTAPLRSGADIDQAIAMLQGSSADSVISVAQIDEPHPAKTLLLSDGYLRPLLPQVWRETLRRQDLEPVYRLNGAIYCTRRDVIVGGSLWGKRTMAYVMPAERSVNIDSPVDLMVAEAVLAHQHE